MNRSLALVGIILLGFALRLFHLNTVPLRGDEAFTVIHWMREPLAQTLANIATVDPQAPLSYVLYRGWALVFGTNENVVRFLPALISLLGVPAIYALGHRLRGTRLGLLAALAWAVNPYQIWHAQDARSYAVWAALSLIALWLALRALDKRRRIDWLLYVIAGTLAAYVYYLELFIILALNLYVFAVHWRARRLLTRWIGAEVAIGLLLAPWYLQPRLLFGSGYGGTAGQFDPPQLLTRFIPTLTFGIIDRLPPGAASALAATLGVALLIGLVIWWRRNRQQALLVGLVGLLPLLLLGIVSTRLNVFEPRYVLGAAPAYALIECVLVLSLRPALLRAISGGAIIVVSLLFLGNYYFLPDYAKANDWRALAAYLSDNVQPGDWVTQAAADMSFVFYCQEYAVAATCDDQLPANPDQPDEEIEQLMAERAERNAAVWYVAQPPNWQNAHVAEDWLVANMQPVRSTSVGGLRVLEYKPWDVASAEIQPEPLATFDDAVQLVGAQTSLEPTDSLAVLLYWRPLAETDTPLKIFLHLRGGDQIVSQDDQFPQDGRIDTTSWGAAAIYRDVYTLPLDGIPAGDYALVAGFYDPETNRRLAVGDGDSFTIQTIHVPG